MAKETIILRKRQYLNEYISIARSSEYRLCHQRPLQRMYQMPIVPSMFTDSVSPQAAGRSDDANFAVT
jgi:hypothetical protein